MMKSKASQGELNRRKKQSEIQLRKNKSIKEKLKMLKNTNVNFKFIEHGAESPCVCRECLEK